MSSSRFPIILLIALIAIFGLQIWNRNRPLPPTRVEWWTQYDLAAEHARKQGKPLLVKFYADW